MSFSLQTRRERLSVFYLTLQTFDLGFGVKNCAKIDFDFRLWNNVLRDKVQFVLL